MTHSEAKGLYVGKPPVLKSVQLTNLLSFGDRSEPFELGSLNVLIGPNGSGKSNFVEAVGLLRGAPRQLSVPVREGGGVHDWLWKGAPRTPKARIEVVVDYPQGDEHWGSNLLRYRLEFTEVGQRLEVMDERIENAVTPPGYEKPFFYFGYQNGRPMLSAGPNSDPTGGRYRELRREELDPQQSVLSQRKDPHHYPEITYVGNLFESFQLYREWSFGRYTAPRVPQPADLPNEFLIEDARNLGLVLNRLRKDVTANRQLLEYLRKLYDQAEDIHVNIESGTVQVFLRETNYTATIPATRLSDGTLRWLSLLAILLDPSPAPLVCVEEPELGLHPDMMPTVATLLRDASERMQLIVTTHSDALVDALNDSPEAIVVCEKENGSTTLKRLNRQDLAEWLERYTLGQLWRSGELGGNRW